MAEIVISDRFAEQCSVVARTNYDTCGSFTRSQIDFLSKEDLEALYVTGGKWHEMESWFKHSIEMKACGTPVVPLYDWIMGNAKTGRSKLLNFQKIGGGRSLMMPWIWGKQASIINNEYWFIDSSSGGGGGVQSGYTAGVTGPLTSGQLAEGVAGDRWIRVKSRYGVDLDAKYFNPLTHIHILSRSAGVVEQGQWKVLASALATNGTYIDVLIESQNAGSDAPFDATPTAGLVTIGRNNVNDYEKWCHNLPNWDPNKRVPFWFQTSRRSRCVDSEYMKAFSSLRRSNAAFAEFGDMDLAQRNVQDEMTDRRRFVWDFFFNKPISGDQNLSDWEQLEDIQTPSGFSVDPGTGGKVVGKRANFIGVVEQLRRCDRVLDLNGQALNFYEFTAELYRIKRSRESNRRVTDIDVWTDSQTAARLHTAFLGYWKQESLEMAHINIDVPTGRNETLGIAWSSYTLKRPSGVRINIIVDNFFDDFRDANATENQEVVGSIMAILDWSTIYWAPIASNKKSFTVGELSNLAKIDKDWSCVLETVTQEKTLISDTGTAVVECPHDSLWIWGIGDKPIVLTGETTPEDNLY